MEQRTGMASRAFLAGGLLTALAAQAGCAGLAASNAQADYLKASMEQLEYRQSCDSLFPVVQQLLAERQFTLTATGPYTFQTNIVPFNTTNYHQYFGQGIATATGGCRIILSLSDTFVNGAPTVRRDFRMEYEVLRRVDPRLAAQIQTDSSAAGERARQRYEAQNAAQNAAAQPAPAQLPPQPAAQPAPAQPPPQ